MGRELGNMLHEAEDWAIAKDIVVVTESDVQNHGGNPSLVLYPALREGKEIYRAGG